MNRNMSSHAYREVIAMVAYLHAGTQRWNLAEGGYSYLTGDGYAHLKNAAVALLSDAFDETTANAVWNVMIDGELDVTSSILAVCTDACAEAMLMQDAEDYDTAERAGHNFTAINAKPEYSMTYRGRLGMLVDSYDAAEAAMVTIGRGIREALTVSVSRKADEGAAERAIAYHNMLAHPLA